MGDKSMVFRITADDKASAKFAQIAAALDQLARKLDEVGRKNVAPRVTADTTAAKTRVDELAAALKELKNQRLRVDVDMGDARDRVGDLRRVLSYLRNANVKVNLTGPAELQLTRTQQLAIALRELDGRNATARAEITGIPGPAEVTALRRAAEALRELDGRNAAAVVSVTGNLPDPRDLRAAARALRQLQDVGEIVIRISVTGDIDALARIAQLRRELRGIPPTVNTRVNVNADRSISGRLAAVGKALLAIGAAGGLAAAGAGSATAALATLSGSLASLVGLAPLAVGGLTALVAVVATAKVGLSGLEEAFKNLDDPKKFAEALKDLSPSAREFATSVRDLKPAFTGLKLDVQQKLFSGLGREFRDLGLTYLPTLRTGMGGIATQLNGLGKDFVGFATQASTLRDVNSIFADTGRAVAAARPGVINLAAAFTDVAAVGTSMLPELATGWTNATGRFREFIAQARESGQLKVWIQDGVDTLQTLGSITGNVGSSLASVFRAAKASGADFLGTLDTVTGKVAALLRSAEGQSALIAFFRESRSAVDALTPGVEDLSAGVLQLLKSLSETGGVRSFAEAVSGLASTAAELGPAIGSVAGDGLGALAGAAKLATGALSPLVTGLGGVLDSASGLAGPLLAAVVAYKALGLAATGFAAAGARAAAASAAISGSFGAAFVPGSAAAATGLSRLSTALNAMGRALPIAGVALIALGALFDKFGPKADRAAQSVISGSQTMAKAIDEEAKRNRARIITWDDAAATQEAYANASKTVTAEFQAQYSALSPMAKLQADVAVAQANLNDAVAQYGAHSSQAATAGQALASANSALKTATDGAASAGRSQNEVLRDTVDAARTAIGAQLDLESALARVAESQKAANEATKKYGAGSAEAAAANRDFVTSADQAALAAQKRAEADAAAAGATNAADIGSRAYGATLLQLAANASGPAQSALLGYIAKLDDAQLAALSAGAEASGFATKILTLPDGRTVKIAIDPETGKIISTQQLLDGMQDKTVTINGNSQPLQAAIDGLMGQLAGKTGTVTINGDSVPAQTALQTVIAAIQSGQGTVVINGQAVPAETALSTIINQINAGNGTVTVNGQTVPAGNALAALLGTVNSSSATSTINGNPTPGQAALNGLMANVRSSRGDVNVGANTGGANSAIDYAARDRYSTIYVKSVSYGSPALTRAAHGGAIGGIVHAMRDGGVVGATGYADGGLRIRPMRGGIAQRVRPNDLRVIGDRVDVDEFYLPDNDAPRSMEIGTEWARRRGLSLVATRSLSQQTTVARPGSTRSVPSLAAARVVATSARQAGATAVRAHLDDARMVAELRSLAGVIAGMGGDGAGDVVAELRALRPVLVAAVRTSAAAAAQARRTDSELGGLR